MAKEKKLDLFGQLLPALDRGDVNFYNKLDDDAKKEFAPLVVMRFFSTVADPNLVPHHLIMTNELVNYGFWELSKYPDLQYQLLAYCGSGTKQRHSWIANPKRSDSKAAELLSDLMTDIPLDEIELLVKLNTFEELVEMIEMYGLQEKEIKEFKKKLKKELAK